MYKLRRPQLSQNFLRSRTLVNQLVRSSSIGPNDLVLEIGPGEGIITRGFTSGRRINQNLRPFFTPAELNSAAARLGFSSNSLPSALTFPQWLALFSKLRYHS